MGSITGAVVTIVTSRTSALLIPAHCRSFKIFCFSLHLAGWPSRPFLRKKMENPDRSKLLQMKRILCRHYYDDISFKTSNFEEYCGFSARKNWRLGRIGIFVVECRICHHQKTFLQKVFAATRKKIEKKFLPSF